MIDDIKNINFRRYSFYSLVAALEKSNSNDKFKLDDVIFRTNSSLAFPATEIEKVNLVKSKLNGRNIYDVMINFFGIHGSTSQLPGFFLDSYSNVKEVDGEGWQPFNDFFHNHLIKLFYKSIKLRGYHRSFNCDFSDPVSKIMISLLGMNNNRKFLRDGNSKYLAFASLLSSFRRPVRQIEKLLEDSFDLEKVLIKQNVPLKISIPDIQKLKLGIKNCILGDNSVCGSVVKSVSSKIVVVFPNLNYEVARKFLPHGHKFSELCHQITFLTNNENAVDLDLDVKYSERMSVRLAKDPTIRLGWNAVLGHPNKENYLIKVSCSN